MKLLLDTHIRLWWMLEPKKGSVCPARLAAQHFELLPINAMHAAEVALLPDHHQDPFDRLLIAQAQVEGMTLLTADRALKPYTVNKIIVGAKRLRS